MTFRYEDRDGDHVELYETEGERGERVNFLLTSRSGVYLDAKGSVAEGEGK